MFEKEVAMVKPYADKVKAGVQKFKDGEGGMTDVVEIVKSLGLIVVIGAIMIFIADRVVTTTGTPTNANLSAFQNNTLGAAQTGSSFVVILIIAFIGSIAIGYMAFFGGKKE